MLARSARTPALGLVFAAAVAGCSDDDPSEDPVKQCKAMVDAFCSNVVDCMVEGGSVAAEDRDATVDECKTGAQKNVDCSKAIGVSESYDDCIARLKAPDCDAINDAIEANMLELPTTCEGVIGIQE